MANSSPANCIPTLADNVFFDNTSSNGTSFAIRVDTAAVYCNSMTLSDAPVSSVITISTANALYINGSLTLSATMSLSGSLSSPYSHLYFTSNQPNNTITSNGRSLGTFYYTYFQSISGNGSWKIMDNLSTGRHLQLNRGHLDLSGYNVSTGDFYCPEDDSTAGFSGKLSSRTIDFHNCTINIAYNWRYIGGQQITTTHSVNSVIKVASSNSNNGYFISKNNDYYHNVEHVNVYGTNQCNGGTSYFNKITFNNTAQGVLNNAGTIYPDSLIFANNGSYRIYGNFAGKEIFTNAYNSLWYKN